VRADAAISSQAEYKKSLLINIYTELLRQFQNHFKQGA